MKPIFYIDRASGRVCKESVYGKFFVGLSCNRYFSFISSIFCKGYLFSRVYGFFQKMRLSKSKVRPFIKKYGIDVGEFSDSVDVFKSFNDFFIRKLSESARPICCYDDAKVAVLPADARYLVFPNVSDVEKFLIKGQVFSLVSLLNCADLADKYSDGSMVIGRLAPVDYHRFHFPVECVVDGSVLVNGNLFSVNPKVLCKNFRNLMCNKRFITKLKTNIFGDILFIEVGATNVGSIKHTSDAGCKHFKGHEKGYFSFGGSCIILLFERGVIDFAKDLLDNSGKFFETKANFGTFLGRAK